MIQTELNFDNIKNGRLKFELKMEGAARTQAPTTTNYDVGSATWTDLRKAPLRSAMEVTPLGHGPF
ncbi:hypothetical protein Fmac_026980 [Flemingia macrophylla]|uniref:Uncharacterized protein n=1 Tax=Flemingia macrophylla TaxID=520843 RepID=A0ABD1LGF3_9FABA